MAIKHIVKKLVTWKDFLTSRKAISLAVFALFLLGIFFVINPVSAQTGSTPGVVSSNGFFSTDTIFNSISWLMMKIAQYCLSLVMFVLSFIIEVASYNGYLDSSAVNTGWVMVRDLTNMVFVVALLAIAFGTILGVENYEWKSMLFKLVSAAVLVNFSRIICGVLIDVAQVVMITFLNGIAATVGGNFIRAFSLEKIQSFDAAVTGGQIDVYSVFIGSMAALFVSVTILVVMCIMLAMLIARMIVLWVLIVLSPIAFVFAVLRKTEAYSREWWEEFGKNVITGPVLIFFIWLTLVTVGNGVVNQEILRNANGAPDAGQIKTGVMHVLTGDNLINFAIAIGMLLVGITVTKRLGGIGSDWAGKAVDYGKKATFALSGVAAVRAVARSGAQKVSETARKGGALVLQKAPIVGTDAWKRRGTDVKNRFVRSVGAPIAEWKNKKIGDLMKTSYDEKEKNPFKKIVSGAAYRTLDAFTGSKYAVDMAKKRGEEATTKMEIAGRVSSTSSHPDSKSLLNAEARLAEIKATGEKIKAEKEEKERMRREQAYRIYEEEKRAGGTDEEQASRRAEKLKKLGYDSSEISRFENIDFQRKDKSISSGIETSEMGEFTQASQREIAQERLAGLGQQEIVVPGKRKESFQLDMETTGDQGVVDRRNNENNKKIYEFTTFARSQGYSDEEIKLAEDKLIKGEKVELGKDFALDLSKGAKSAKAELSAKAQALGLTEDQVKEMEKDIGSKVNFQSRRTETVRMAKVGNQAGEEVAAQKKKVEAETEERLLKDDKAYKARDARITDANVKTKQIQEKLDTNRQIELLTSIKNLLAGGFGEKQDVINREKARLADMELEAMNSKNMAAAEARDSFLKQEKRVGEATFVQQESDRQAKARAEQQAIGTFPQAMARFNQQIETVKKLRAEKAPAAVIARAERTLGDMYYANGARHSAFAMAAGDKILGEQGNNIGAEINIDNIRKLQAGMISTRLGGELVEATQAGLNDGLARLREQYKAIYGDKKYLARFNADMAYDASKMEAMAGQGHTRYAGLTTSVVNPETGDIETKFTGIDSQNLTKDDIEHIQRRRIAAAATSKITAIDGFGGSVDTSQKGEAVVSSDTAKNFVVELAKSLKGVQLRDVEEYTKRTYAEIFMHSDESKVKELLGLLEANVKDEVALEGLIEFAFSRMTKKADEEKYKTQKERDDKEHKLEINYDLVSDALSKIRRNKGARKGP